MPSSQLLGPVEIIRADVAAVVGCARRAPSIHNTQPWRWTFDGHNLDLRADRSRQLHVADRDGHSLLVSCGAAAELTALALRAHGWSIDVTTMPTASDPDLLTRFTLVSRADPDPTAGVMLAAAGERRSERRTFGAEPVSQLVIDRLKNAASSDGVYAHFPSRRDEILDLAVAVSAADRSERDDPEYAAEMALWRHGRTSDGIPDAVIPEVRAHHPRHTDVPLRDFEAGVPGGQLIAADVDEKPLLAVIFTDSDRAVDRLLAGRAMVQLMIRAELEGLATCPLSQSVDLLVFRTRLRTLMSWSDYPQMMLRLGARPAGQPAALTPRRPVDQTLTMV
jgi:nitroreductase